MSQQICSRRPIQAPSGVFPPSKSAGLSARSCVTSQAHEAFLRAISCPSRASFQCFSQASGASRSQHRLSSFLLTKYGSRGCNAVGCANTNGHRPTNTRSSIYSIRRLTGRYKLQSSLFRGGNPTPGAQAKVTIEEVVTVQSPK